MKNIKLLPIAQIRRDSGAQFRPSLVDSHVSDIAEAIQTEAPIPPIIVFFDGALHWMADGDHRIEAHIQTGKEEILSEVKEGTQLDARRFGRQANSETLALKRSPQTKRAQVKDALTDPEWANWSNVAIGDYCKVSHEFVRQLRGELGLTSNVGSDERTYTTKHGTVAKMKTGKIGKAQKAETPEQGSEPAPVLVELDPSEIKMLWEDPEFAAKYPLSVLTDAGVTFDGTTGYFAFNDAIKEGDPVDPNVPLRIGIAPDIVEGFYSLGVMWTDGRTSVLHQSEPPEMLVFRLDAWGVTTEMLKHFRWKGNPHEENETVITVMIKTVVQIGSLLRAVESGPEIGADWPTLEEYLRDELPMLSTEAAQTMMEAAELWRDEGQLQADVFCELADKASLAWQQTNFREVWPRFKEIMAEQMALADAA